MNNFDNKIALVTGASGSIGAAIAISLHGKGAHVIISGTNKTKLEELGNILQNNYTIKLANLRNMNETTLLVSELQHIDILVCNAGITNDVLSIKMTDEIFSDIIDVNLKSNFILNREAIKKMMKQRYGRIINISSVVGIIGNPGQANYSASKAGLIGMTKSLAQEVASRNITINAVAPGFIESNMTDKLSDQAKDYIMQKIPMKFFGKPQDIANIVVFLASDEARYITGQTIHVNGGMVMV
jgi:3-oxoacyl-[acyl-carrier protein] reductase